MIKKINKIKDIKKIIKCPYCKDGLRKLNGIYVSPLNGKVFLSYSICSYSFCRCNVNMYLFTDIVIPELILGE